MAHAEREIRLVILMIILYLWHWLAHLASHATLNTMVNYKICLNQLADYVLRLAVDKSKSRDGKAIIKSDQI